MYRALVYIPLGGITYPERNYADVYLCFLVIILLNGCFIPLVKLDSLEMSES